MYTPTDTSKPVRIRLENSFLSVNTLPIKKNNGNTIASLIAILTGNHGYNSTYSQGKQSLRCALSDVETQMSLGLINNALVLEFDEQVEAWDNVLQLIHDHTDNIAKAYVLTAK